MLDCDRLKQAAMNFPKFCEPLEKGEGKTLATLYD